MTYIEIDLVPAAPATLAVADLLRLLI